MKFEIQGRLKGGIVGKAWNSFTKEIESSSEKNAIDKVYSLMGSKHGLKRNQIKIDGVKTIE